MAVYKVAGNYYSDELYHHGVKGMRHGVRRWQNLDGSYTNAGYAHYGIQKPGAQKMANQGRLTEYTDSGSGRGASVNTAVPVHNSGKADKAAYAAYKYGGAGGYKAYRGAKKTGRAAKDWVGQRAEDARNWGNERINDANRFFARGTREAAEEAQNRLDANRDILRADSAKRIQDNNSVQLQRQDRQFGPSQQYADQMNESTRINYVNNQRQLAEMGREARRAQDAYDASLAKRVDDARDWAGQRVEDVRKWGDQAGRDIGKAADNARDWAGQRVSDVRKWGDQAGRDIGKAADNAKNWTDTAAKNVGGAVKTAGDWVGDRARDAGEAVGKAARNAGGAVSGAAKDVGKWASGAVSKGRDFISGLFGKKKK